ncbi:YcjX family protein [Shigella sonnei]
MVGEMANDVRRLHPSACRRKPTGRHCRRVDRSSHHCKQQGLHFIQPGRFVLPGDMAGAPALQFFPWPDVDAWASPNWRRPISTPMPECCASVLIITARKW